MKYIDSAREAWTNGAVLRQRRRRYKAFTYGRQWDDLTVTADGRRMTEYARMQEEGRTPITNNLIRQMVKGIVGRYRYLSAMDAGGDEVGTMNALLARALAGGESPLAETDARGLEEFLISGTVIQRIGEEGDVENVSLERYFYAPFQRADGSDCRLMGMLHDMAPAEVLSRFSGGDPGRADAIKQAYRGEMQERGGIFDPDGSIDFSMPGVPGTWRVIEVWEKVGADWLDVYDPFTDSHRREEAEAIGRLRGLNRARRQVGSREICWSYRAADEWRQRWLTPGGGLLAEKRGGRPPFVVRFYPMIDGEVHSLVEDVVHQQKYVNRLISLLDHIISASAKGVLLYPSDQLPDGLTWRDLRRIWSTPNGIMPYKRTGRGVAPQQVHTSSGQVGAGASEMLKTQLELFEEISGGAASLRGVSNSANGEGMLRAQLENATICLLDLLAAFHSFISERDKARKQNINF